ncbi:MAG: sugar ABC transporter substrate-binding protein [Ruminococcus sp.]|jgi:ribose transport system substrate-binding protein
MKKKVISALLAVTMVAVMMGCGGNSETGGGSESGESAAAESDAGAETESQEKEEAETGAEGETMAAEDIVVGFANKGQNAWLEQQSVGIQDACKDLGLPEPTIVYADSQENAESQVQAIEDFMSLGANVIIIDPISADVVKQALQNAKDQGVVVIDVDTIGGLDDVTHCSIGLDEYTASYNGAEKFCQDYLEEGDGVVIIAGSQGDPAAENRLKGMKEACEANGIKVLGSQYTDWSVAMATTVMEDLIVSKGDEIDGVLVPSDDLGIGAITALEQAGMTDVKMMGYGGFQIALDAIDEGQMSMTVGMHPYDNGYQAVETAVNILTKGEYPEEHFIDVGTDLITTENYTEFEGF